MGRELYAKLPAFRAELDRCEQIFVALHQRSLLEVMFDDDSTRLNRTEYTQPALFALEVALAEVLRKAGLKAAVLLGHSVGELAAACYAEVFDLQNGLSLISTRARLMQALPAGGAMLALRAGEQRVREVLVETSLSVDIAALNSPQATVVSGPAGEIERARVCFEARDVVGQRLTVSHAFHSALMEPMLADFERAASATPMRAARVPLISNVSGAPFEPGQAPDAAYWTRHVRAPVRFSDGLRHAQARGCDVFVELGPQPTLVGLGKRCLGRDAATWIETLSRDESEADCLNQAMERLDELGLLSRPDGMPHGSAGDADGADQAGHCANGAVLCT